MARHYIRHHYLNDTSYFITMHTVKKKRILASDETKLIVFKTICDFFQRYEYRLYAWVIFDDHYHLLFQTRVGDDFKKLFLQINNHCRANIKKELRRKISRSLFFNYWDVCIRTKDDFYRHFNYIHDNSIKHGYANHQGEYKFSSYRFWEWRRNRYWLANLLLAFPPQEISLKEDENLYQRTKGRN